MKQLTFKFNEFRGLVGSRLLCVLLTLTLLSVLTHAAPPGILNHQGLINVDDAPFDGTGSFKFALVDAAGTTTYWSNDGASTAGDEPTDPVSLTVTNGRYSVALGDTTITNMTAEIPASVFSENTDVYLRVWFDDGSNDSQLLAPDQRIASVGYALSAAKAQSVADGAITSAMLADDSVGTDQLAAGTTFNGSFEGDGSALTDLDSKELTGHLTVGLDVEDIGHIDDGGTARDVAVSGDWAYLANGNDGLRVFNISAPENSVSSGHIDDGGNARAIVLSGNLAFLANSDDGLRIYDVSNPAVPANAGHITASGPVNDIAVSGNYAYLLGNRLYVYDISNPSAPAIVGNKGIGDNVQAIVVSGEYAYLADTVLGLRIVDISTPSVPVFRSAIGSGAYGVAVSGDHAYLGSGSDGLRIYNVSDPANPFLVGQITPSGFSRGVAVSGDYAYLGSLTAGLRIYDITDPTQPAKVGQVHNGESVNSVAISGEYAYLASANAGLGIFRVRLAAVAPRFVGDGSGLTGIDIASVLDQGNNAEGLGLTNLGNLGIGTSTPSRGLVDIEGYIGFAAGPFGWLNGSGNTGTNPGTNTANYSVYASNRIAAGEFNAHSDARIKKIRGLSMNKADLETLMEIEITDYVMIDQVTNGSRPYKKVIGQQVHEVYPQAVTLSTNVVPDIYRAAMSDDGWIALATDLTPGEKIKLIAPEHTGVHEVLAVRGGAFQIATKLSGEVFVYGRQVDDFHNVDYEAIAMLHVSAAQEQQRIIEKQVAEMKSQKRALESLKRRLRPTDDSEALAARLSKLEGLVGRFLSQQESSTPAGALAALKQKQ